MTQFDPPIGKNVSRAAALDEGPGRFGWVVRSLGSRLALHAILLVGGVVFLLPFAWMVLTSVKTDEELSGSWQPAVPTFRAASPYVREAEQPSKPMDVPAADWEAALPHLRASADAAVADATAGPADLDLSAEQRAAWRESAAVSLVDALSAKLNKAVWDDPAAAASAFAALLTPADASAALDAALSRLELRGVQVRTLDARTSEVGGEWNIVAGDARLLSDATLAYRFESPDAAPVVLERRFTFPADPSELHKVIVSLRSDDSWHRLSATLAVGGRLWRSTRDTSLAQHRPMSVIFQPPTFEDDTNKPRTWVPLENAGPAESAGRREATLRLTLAPSSTPRAILGKATRNYERAFLSVPFWTYVGNSVLLVALTTLGTLFSSTFVAYAFARLEWPGRSFAFLLLLATMMLPAQVTMIPSFLIWRQLGWYNTLNPLWVPAWFGGAFFIFLMTQHMKSIPRGLEESARIDGLNAVQTWYYIILPLVRPAATAVAILTFMAAWNEFMGPLIYLRDQDKFPLSLGLFGMRIDVSFDWTTVMAGNLLMTFPVIVIFFVFQRYFIQGMTMSEMKG